MVYKWRCQYNTYCLALLGSRLGGFLGGSDLLEELRTPLEQLERAMLVDGLNQFQKLFVGGLISCL